MTGTPSKWCIASADLGWACWNGECLVFDPRSGDTHYLDPVASAALRLLATAPSAEDVLAAMLADELELADAASIRGQVTTLLAHLSELGLVDRRADRQ